MRIFAIYSLFFLEMRRRFGFSSPVTASLTFSAASFAASTTPPSRAVSTTSPAA
jgi:hypothetical protein